nr:unnamed protein product [Callosobruchus chinensis]
MPTLRSNNSKVGGESDPETPDTLKDVLLSDAFKELIGEIVRSETALLQSTITELRSEVIALRDSNKELIALLTNNESLSKTIINADSNVESGPASETWSTVVNKKSRNPLKTNVPHKNDAVVEVKKPVNKFRQQNFGESSNQALDDNSDINEETTKGKGVYRHPTSRRKSKAVFGSGKDSTGFKAAHRRTWIYVGRATPGTSEDDIKNVLQKKFEDRDFIIEKLPKWKNAQTESFKVGADKDLEDDLFDSSMWPVGTLVKKYTFFREQK